MHRWLWIALILSLALSTLPSAVAMFSAPPGFSWTGILSRNTADVNGYLSMIEEARQGSWRMRNLFTAEPHEPFQIRPLWLSIGLSGRFIPFLSNVWLMEIGRLITVSCLLLIIAKMARTLFTARAEQLIGFLVITFGSGIGWIGLVKDPPDLRIVETSTFLTLISPPLYSLSLSLILSVVLLTARVWNSKEGFAPGMLAGLCCLWLGFDRPFSIATLGLAIVAFLAVRIVREKHLQWDRVRNLLPLLIGALIPILYQLSVIQKSPVYAAWNKQHILPTPPWANLIVSLGLMIPLALIGAKPAFARNASVALLCASYVAASLLLSHLPIGYQERFLEGLPIMTATFASFGVITILQRLKRPMLRTLIGLVMLVVLSLSHIRVIQTDMTVIAKQGPPQYMPDRLLDSMRKLQSLAEPEEAILSAEPTGNFLVAYAGRPVVLGQKIQTARYFEKHRLVSEYFSTPAQDPRSRDLFLQTQATWLFWGPQEAWISRGRFDPSQADYLEEMASDGPVRIFKRR